VQEFILRRQLRVRSYVWDNLYTDYVRNKKIKMQESQERLEKLKLELKGDKSKLSEEEEQNADLLETQASTNQENELITEDLVRGYSN
jgi:hypothetical protein